MNLLEFMERMTASAKTKSEFGRAMHDPDLDEETKQKILEEVERAGGYDNLDD